MKAEDMPTPPREIQGFEHWVYKHGNSELHASKNECLWWYEADRAKVLEQRLAVQTATAQSLRLIVERAVEYARHKESCRLMGKIPKWHDFNRGPGYTGGCSCGLDALLAEIGARSAEAIQERK